MRDAPFDVEDVRLAEALFRSAGHCRVACELYSIGRGPDALLQAAKPMTDVLPWVETEARAHSVQLAVVIRAIARVGAAIRAGKKPAAVRKAFGDVEDAVEDFVESVGDGSRAKAFDAIVALELLRSTHRSFQEGVATGDVSCYQSAYATATEALHLLSCIRGDRSPDAREHVGVLRLAFPSAEPPEGLVRPETIERAIEGLTAALTKEHNIALSDIQGLDASLAKIERLLDDTVSAHSDGVPALAARLASSLYVRSYDPIRAEIAARDEEVEARLSQLLGVDMRIAINRGVSAQELDGLRREAKELLSASRAR